MESKTRPFKNLKKWVRGIFDHIKYSLYLNLELFICYNFGHFKIKSLFLQGERFTIIMITEFLLSVALIVVNISSKK